MRTSIVVCTLKPEFTTVCKYMRPVAHMCSTSMSTRHCSRNDGPTHYVHNIERKLRDGSFAIEVTDGANSTRSINQRKMKWQFKQNRHATYTQCGDLLRGAIVYVQDNIRLNPIWQKAWYAGVHRCTTGSELIDTSSKMLLEVKLAGHLPESPRHWEVSQRNELYHLINYHPSTLRFRMLSPNGEYDATLTMWLIRDALRRYMIPNEWFVFQKIAFPQDYF